MQSLQKTGGIGIKCLQRMTFESLVEVFKPLSVFSDALSGENHVTVSALRPLLNLLRCRDLSVAPADMMHP